ncbi:Protein NDR1 [Raphanus sativus]|uniref:Protein NDR1 n=1 Tax=Raphanus sativus TaxID=3726 RepID=A0A6J0JLZ9_RAPSA|nr:protein NDR1 [Raphanus sativus]KAJ4869540.1 Protein NDR1 [Raphanus sativus]
MDIDQDTDSGGRSCCSCCLSFIFTAGLTSLFLWLSLRADKPKCSIEYFYVPSLNKSLDAHSRLNTTLNFMVRLANPNRDQGIYYDDVHLSFSNTNSSVANYTVPRFYQGHKKKAKKWGQTLPVNNQTVSRAVLSNGSAVFRMDLKTQVRFKIIFWKTKRYGIEVGADVEVNGDGVKAHKKGIKMKKSDSSTRLRNYFPICVLMNLLVFFAIR